MGQRCWYSPGKPSPRWDRSKYASGCGRRPKGAYVLADAPAEKPDVILMAERQRSLSLRGAYEKLKA